MRIQHRVIALVIVGLSGVLSQGQSTRPEALQKADRAFEEASRNQVNLTAPKHFEKAHKAYLSAVNTFDKGGRIQRIENESNKALELLAEAGKRAELSRVVLQDVLEMRTGLIGANVPVAASRYFREAEQKFQKAAMQAEQDEVKAARSMTQAAAKSYRSGALKYLQEVTWADASKKLKAAKGRVTKKAFAEAQNMLSEVKADLARLNKTMAPSPAEIVKATRMKTEQALAHAGI